MLEEWFFELMRLKDEGLAEGAKKGYSMDSLRQVFEHFEEEWLEFVLAYKSGKFKVVMKELADLSNMCDLLFEELFKLKKAHEIDNPKRIKFKDRDLQLTDNPRTNICSICGKKYPTELRRQTILHHEFYDSTKPLAHTIELCSSCHAKTYGLGTTIGIGRGGK